MIVTILFAVESADFLYLLRETRLTKGNLSTHLAGWKRRATCHREDVSRQGPADHLPAQRGRASGLQRYRAWLKRAARLCLSNQVSVPSGAGSAPQRRPRAPLDAKRQRCPQQTQTRGGVGPKPNRCLVRHQTWRKLIVRHRHPHRGSHARLRLGSRRRRADLEVPRGIVFGFLGPNGVGQDDDDPPAARPARAHVRSAPRCSASTTRTQADAGPRRVRRAARAHRPLRAPQRRGQPASSTGASGACRRASGGRASRAAEHLGLWERRERARRRAGAAG